MSMRIMAVRPLTAGDLAPLAESAVARDAGRLLRAPLLAAFDVYKSNLSYGILTESEAEHQRVAAWYRRLLDLDPVAITEVPPAVAAYVGKGVSA